MEANKTYNEYTKEIESIAQQIEQGKVSPEEIPTQLRKVKENIAALRNILRETTELSQSILNDINEA